MRVCHCDGTVKVEATRFTAAGKGKCVTACV